MTCDEKTAGELIRSICTGDFAATGGKVAVGFVMLMFNHPGMQEIGMSHKEFSVAVLKYGDLIEQ